jgi:subtilase family serine protease
MSKSRTLVCLLWSSFVLTSLSYAATPDRIAGELNSGQRVQLYAGSKALFRPGSDIGRADGTRVIEGVSLHFQLSSAQQTDLKQFLAQLGNPRSPNYHKYLTISQYAERFGMSQNDLNKVVAWLQSQGFTNIKVAPAHNRVAFDGTVAQIESLFSTEMHNYLVNSEIHLANALNPSVPLALSGIVKYVGHLNDFAPKPRAKVRPNFTSYVSGNHFLTPGDFATIYDVNALYSANVTGLGQKIVIVGQSTVSPTDLANFRSAAGLSVNAPTLTLIEGTATRCSGDEGESDLDLEWSGGVAKDAKITFLYAGLGAGDTCTNRFDSVWDALEDALTGSLTQGVSGSPIAPFVSTSYGFCEQGLQSQDPGFVSTIQGWVQTGQTLGVTLTSASGDAGAADCDASDSTSASQGLAVDVPASIPETTGAGGNEFTGDSAGAVSGNQAAADNPYWGPSGAGTDGISTALEYIPEEAWNDTTENLAANPPGGLAASGGGASVIFSKPTWQSGTGVPSGSARYVPDISLSASADHDSYLFCSEDASATSCAVGFRESAGGNLTAVGGTSAVAPTFTAIMALVNQYVGNTPPTGLAPINPTLYSLPGNSPNPFHDVTTGNNIVPCTAGTTGCPTATPFQYGFNAGTGYDQVTGLGSVDAYNLAQIWARKPTTITISPSATSVNPGTNVTFTATVTPSSTTGTVNFYDNGSSTALGSGTLSGGTATFATTSLPLGSNSVNATYGGDSGSRLSTTTTPAVVSNSTSFSLSSSLPGTNPTLSVAQGQTSGAVNLTVTSSNGFLVSSGSGQQTLMPVTYTCSGLPSESTCFFNGTQNTVTTQLTSVTLTIQTTAPTTKLERPLDRGPKIFYAVLLPGVLGIFVTMGSRKRVACGVRLLGLILVLGFSTIWLASCGGSSTSSNKNPGTPVGSSSITVNATTNGGPSATPPLQFTLTVSAIAR